MTLFDRFTDATDRAFTKHSVPGCAVGISSNEGTRVYCKGVTNVDHPLEVTPQTRFQIGSVTKTYTATVVCKLVEEGVLDLDKPVLGYLPRFRVRDAEVSRRVSIRHLLTHMTGWPDAVTTNRRRDSSLSAFVDSLASVGQVAPLGWAWSYCNAGYALAGFVIERLLNEPFAEAIKEHLLLPLGLEQTHLDPLEVMVHRFAVGHARNGAPTLWHMAECERPFGGIMTSIHDLLAYGRSHIPGNQSVVGTEILEMMHSPLVPVWQDTYWGLGWEVNELVQGQKSSHLGVTSGQSAVLLVYRDKGTVVAAMVNGGDSHSFLSAIGDLADTLVAGGRRPRPPEHHSEEQQMDEYLGTFIGADSTVTIVRENTDLVCKIVFASAPDRPDHMKESPPPARAIVTGKDTLSLADGPFAGLQAQAVRNNEGRVAWLRIAKRLHPKRFD